MKPKQTKESIVQYSPFETSNNKTSLYSFSEITEQINVQLMSLENMDASEESSTSYRQHFAALDHLDSLCVILNSKGEVVYLNPKGCELLAVDSSDYFGTCWLTQFILPEQRTEMLLVFEQMMLGQGKAYSEYCNEIRTLDQSTLSLEWKNKLLTNANGAILGSFSLAVPMY